MKQLKNFLIKREQSQARLSFAKREKSRLLAKTILTLVALLAVTTGAWADETLLLTIESKDYTTFLSGSKTFDDKVTVTFSNSVYNDGDYNGWNAGGAGSLLTVAGTNGYAVTSCKFYTDGGPAATGYTVEGESPSVYLSSGNVYTDDSKSVSIGYPGIKKIEVYGTAPAAATAVDDFAWTAATKTGTFTMPGDNVTVSVEYYDQATLADKGLTAAVDAAAKTEAPLAVLAENAITGGTVMYYVAPDANFSQADAIALAETAWSADIPTAETIDAAGGTCYVWYYIKGDDKHSDTDPQLLQVTVLPEPTYAVELAEGTEESDKWTVKAGTDGSFQSLPLKGVKAGTKVKLKYDGDRSMLKGVTAVKKAAAAAKTLAEATSEDLGKVVGADGKIYATKADAEAVATGNAVAMICYVNEGHGLALALTDESDMDWSSAKTTCAAHTPAVTGATWKLASKSEMSLMINAAGNYAALRNGFSAVGGTNLSDEYYWLSDESSADYAEYFNFGYGSWSQEFKSDSCKVRACLAF